MPGEVRECLGRPMYLVSDDGRVFSRHRAGHAEYRELRQETLRWGYKRVTLATDKPPYSERVLVHVLVLEAFVGPCPEGYEARHLDGSRDNNNLRNLAWGTLSDNRIDALENNFGVTLDAEGVSKIKKLLKEKGKRQWQIAEMFGVTRQTITDINNGRTWSHVTND
jgi:DNA-binding XRE family transcriptional regulator